MPSHRDPCPTARLEEEEPAHEIITGLWIGNYEAASSEEFFHQHQFKTVINVTPDLPHYQEASHRSYYRIPIQDKDLCDLDLFPLFHQVSDLIKKRLALGPVLVHCKRGHHRSASVIGAYLIKYREFSFSELIHHVNQLRPCALRRLTCMVRGLRNFYLEQILDVNYTLS